MEPNDPLIKGLANVLMLAANTVEYVENKLASCRQRISGKQPSKASDYGNGQEFTELTAQK